MRKLTVFAALLVAGCTGGYLPSMDIAVHAAAPKYLVFAFPQGDVSIELSSNNPAVAHVMEVATDGYYNGSYVYNTLNGKIVQFGDPYWQGISPSPRWLIEASGSRRADMLSHGEVALQVLARPDATHMIVGPQMVIATTYNVMHAEFGEDLIPIGHVIKGEENLKSVVKGDKIISVVPATPVQQ